MNVEASPGVVQVAEAGRRTDLAVEIAVGGGEDDGLAAEAIGCEVAQIANAPIFERVAQDDPQRG